VIPASGDRTRFGMAYFGVRDLDHARWDLDEMAELGLDWLLLPFTHDDALWEVSTFRRLVDAAQARGIEPVISPWGGATFGGEGVETDLSLADWIVRARDTGAPILHVDEPRVSTATLGEVLGEWGEDASTWLTIQPERGAELAPEIVARVAVLGTDAYDGTVAERIAATAGFERLTGRLDLAWVRAFRVPEGDEREVGEAVTAMATLAPLVGIWAWKGSTGRGSLRCANPDLVQASVVEAIRSAALTEAA
jgi:hypothetical protein